MADIKPYSGTSEDRLVALINYDNNSQLVLNVDFTFGPISDYSDEDGRNTQIVLVPTPSNWKTPQTVYYRRLPLDVLGQLPVGYLENVNVNVPFTIHEILDEINEKLGLNLTTQEVENTEYTDGHYRYTLTIKEGSRAWLANSSYQFIAKVTGDTVPISEIISQTSLEDLNWI